MHGRQLSHIQKNDEIFSTAVVNPNYAYPVLPGAVKNTFGLQLACYCCCILFVLSRSSWQANLVELMDSSQFTKWLFSF